MSGSDAAYVRYVRGFFARWSPLYDLFSRPVGFAYAAAVRLAGAAPGRSLLDVCTGTGEVARRAARAGAAVTAVDLTPAMLLRARAKPGTRGVRFAEMDARRLGFADRAFDTVVLSFALHDMPRAARVAALREAVRVSRRPVVVLDYEPPRSRLGARGVVAVLRRFETAYLAGFVRQGGIAGAVADAGLVGARRARPLPGWFSLWAVDAPAGESGPASASG